VSTWKYSRSKPPSHHSPRSFSGPWKLVSFPAALRQDQLVADALKARGGIEEAKGRKRHRDHGSALGFIERLSPQEALP